MFGDDFLLPARGVLLHIGPHKTGTTAIQGAMHRARAAMVAAGVRYTGRTSQAQMAALAITSGKGLIGHRAADQADWDELVDEVRTNSDMRVVVSSEFFDDASDEVAQTVVDELGGERVHVVVTLRPLAKILPSAWQQYVRNRLRDTYDAWLDAMFNKPPYKSPTVTFWQRHRHDVLVERWAKVVGPERLLVIVVDESDPDSLIRTFERITALPDGLLASHDDAANRSLTAAETELVRQVNVAFYKGKWPAERYHNLVRYGATRGMQLREAGRDEARITTPAWAVERANEIAAAAAERIKATGVHVLGDLSTLSQVAVPPQPPSVLTADQLTLDGAASAVVGAIEAVVRERTAPPKPPSRIARNLRKQRRRLRRVVRRLLPASPSE